MKLQWLIDHAKEWPKDQQEQMWELLDLASAAAANGFPSPFTQRDLRYAMTHLPPAGTEEHAA